MTLWQPEYRIKANGSDVTGITLAGFTISSGRKDINAPTEAGYCNLNLILLDNQSFDFDVNTSITIEVKKSNGSYVGLFGGRISDVATQVNSAGSSAVVTRMNITALGALSKLQRAIFDGTLAEGLDGAQILDLLDDLLLNSWNELPAAETWASYDPATQTWQGAENIGLGEIDAGDYTLRSRQISNQFIAGVAQSIASSAGGYLYEDANGNINYADQSHRQDYLVANGYTDLDARNALFAGISSLSRQGDIVNKLTIAHGTNFSNSHTSQDLTSQGIYGLYAEAFDSYIKNSADVTNFANQIIKLRAYPRARFQSITFPIHITAIDDVTRDALLQIFMGLPIRITNLPGNITDGQFEGFVEGWTFRSSNNGLFLTITASPTAYNAVAQQWAQVTATEAWNTIMNTLKWEDAIGVIS